MLGTERRSTRSLSVENWLWKRLWACLTRDLWNELNCVNQKKHNWAVWAELLNITAGGACGYHCGCDS